MRISFVIACALSCLVAAGCARETQERPIRSLAVPRAPAPFPDTAFRSDEDLRAPAPAPPTSRFDTRRIGAQQGEDAPARRYHGATVDLDLKNADLGNVFRLLADVGHVNIVVAGELSGTVTMRLRHVPWDQALDVIVRARGLVLERDGNVIIVRASGA
jgi:hypothetical protein